MANSPSREAALWDVPCQLARWERTPHVRDMLADLHWHGPGTPPSPGSAQPSPLAEITESIFGFHFSASDIIINWTTPPSSPRDSPWRTEGGNPLRRDLEHFTPYPNPTWRSMGHLRPSLRPPTKPPATQITPSRDPLPIHTPAPQRPIAFEQESEMSSLEREQTLWCTPNPPWDMGSPEPEWIRRVTYDEEEGVELTAGLPKDFSRREEDTTRWILAMKAYFIINGDTYDEKAWILVTLNKMSTRKGATFAEGWYLWLTNDDIPLEQKTFEKLDEDFHWAFIPKDLEDWTCQEVYSLTMEQFKGDFDQYASAFRLAQAYSGIDLGRILVDVLQ